MVIKKKILLLSIATTLIILLLAMIMEWSHDKNEALAYINGEEITGSEFLLIQNNGKSEVITYFRQKYKADIDKTFWNRNYNGEIPLEILKQKTMDKLTKLKMEQILAKDKGIIEDISYEAFLDALKNENNTRKKSIESGKVIYGNKQFGELEYYNYRQSNLVLELKKKLMDNELKPSDGELEAYYLQKRDNMYKLGTTTGYRELSEVKEDVAMQIVNTKYDEFIEQMIKKLNLKINDKLYRRIKND
jgi:hypothetical protein